MSIEAYEKVEFEVNSKTVDTEKGKLYKVLLISQNSTDIFLVNKFLNELGNFKVYEAGNLSTAFKVVGYHSLDLIIIDDVLPTISGYDIIKRLNKSQMLKDVPKVMMLTQNYKQSSYDNHSLNNLDFIKKPIDGMIFKTRLASILKNAADKFMSGSSFENMIDKKINEAKEFLKIYKSFLDIDENILFVYDKNRNEVVETNRNFSKFFGEPSLFNRIVSNDKLMAYFVPKSDDTNYLNSHHYSTWIDFITSVQDFNFLITIKRGLNNFSFNITANQIKLFNKEMYIIKLSNHNIYTNGSKQQIKVQNKKISSQLELIKTSLENINPCDDREVIVNNLISLLDELGLETKVIDKLSEPDSQITNVYFVVATLLKNKLDSINATLNTRVIDIDSMEDKEIIYADISADLINDLVKGIIDCYHESENLKVDIKLFKIGGKLKIEIVTIDKGNSVNKTLIERIFDFNVKDEGENGIGHMRPKNIKNSLSELNADIKTYFNDEQNIFLISVPLD